MKQIITNNLATWTTAPKGIKKLRELILELAVRGLLVPQDVNDEPASELLTKIAAEKARLVSEGKIKPPKPLAKISEGEKPFDLPLGWEWARLGNLGEWGSGSTPKRGNSALYGGDIPWFKSGELVGDYISKSEETITEQALKDCSLRLNKVGDVLLAMYGATIGKTSILKIDATTNQAVCGCTPFDGLYNLYLLTVLKGYKPRFINMGTGGAQPNISREKIVTTVVPLPPLAEQQRIVAKVDELMQLCDRLEEKQSGSEAMHRQLVNCLLTTLTEATDAQVFQAAWSRIAANFDCLFTTEHSIEQLKQTILQLAVMGKLVPQNPTDEPASELLKNIATEKARLITEGKIKKQNPLPKISEQEKPFALPNGWEWVRFGSISKLVNGDRGKNYPNRDEYVPEGIPFINTGHIEPDGTLDASNMNFITREKFNSLNGGKIQAGDILYCLRGATMGKTAFVNQYKEGAIASSLVIIRLDKDVLTEKYAYLFLNSPYGKRLIKQYDNGSAQPNLSANSVTLYISPIPPLAEQHRIVTKVDELLTLCEQLKTKLATAQTLQQQLADTLVQQAVA